MKIAPIIIAAFALVCGGYAGDVKRNPKEAVEKLLHQAREAKEAGRMDEAQKLQGEAERIAVALKGKEGMKHQEGEKRKEAMKEKHPEGAKVAVKGPDFERLQHIMQAVEHLNAAGLHEPAEAIGQIAQNMRRELEERMKRREGEAHGGERKHPGEMTVQAEMEEMRQQMRKMAEQIKDLQVGVKTRGS